jgi:hypothetical protein
MALPKAIQKEADQVAALEASMQQAAPAQAPDTPEPAAPPAPADPPVSTAEPAPTPVPPKADDGQWEQKYRTLQGMFSRETQTLRDALRQSNERQNQLAAQVEQLTKQPSKEPKTKLVTEKDAEAFGADLVDMARRVAREEFGEREQGYIDRISSLEQQLKTQVGEVRETQAQTSQNQFFSTLSAAIPGWEQLQNTEACQTWLASKVPGTNFLWNDVLVDAAERHDAGRAIEVFQAFAATQPKQAPAPQPTARSNKAELSRQVTPAKSNATTPSTPAASRTYTAAEYEAESMKIVRLAKAGRVDEAAAIENELNAALIEGRLRP